MFENDICQKIIYLWENKGLQMTLHYYEQNNHYS